MPRSRVWKEYVPGGAFQRKAKYFLRAALCSPRGPKRMCLNRCTPLQWLHVCRCMQGRLCFCARGMRASSLAVAMPTPIPGHVTIFAHAVCVSVSLHILHVCNSSRQHNFPRCSVPQPLSSKQQRGGICVAPSHSFLSLTNQPLILPSFVRYTRRSESHSPTRTRACARAQICTHTRSCTHARTRTQSHMHVCIQTPSLYHLHTHMQTRTHTHTHTHKHTTHTPTTH